MASPLWPHQERALEFVADKPSAMLAMVMRSGKSRVTVEALEGRKARRTLLLCPASVVNVWPAQFQEYGHSSTRVLSLQKGVALKKRTEMAGEFLNHPDARNAKNNVVVMNFEAFHLKPFIDRAMKYPWDALVMDESHRLKSPGGVASRAAARLAHGGGAGRRKIPSCLALTGTPMAHSPDGQFGRGRFRGKPCDSCPMNQFGSGSHGRGKACKEKRMIFMLQPDSYIPLVIQAPTMSIGNLKKYMMRLASRGMGYWGVETELGLESAQQSGGASSIVG